MWTGNDVTNPVVTRVVFRLRVKMSDLGTVKGAKPLKLEVLDYRFCCCCFVIVVVFVT